MGRLETRSQPMGPVSTMLPRLGLDKYNALFMSNECTCSVENRCIADHTHSVVHEQAAMLRKTINF